MRLGQISRKLNLRPIQIRDFIQEEFKVEIDTDLNTKLDDKYIEALNKKFDTTQETLVSQKQIPAEEIKQSDEDRWSKKAAELIKAKKEAAGAVAGPETKDAKIVEAPAAIEVKSEPVVSEEKVEFFENIAESSEPVVASENKPSEFFDPFTPQRVNPDAELIKATNVQLEGPKVIGKIILPPTKKELEAAAAAEAAALAAELAAAAVAAAETDAAIEVTAEGILLEYDGNSAEESILTTAPTVISEIKTKSNPISKKMEAMHASDDEEWSPFKDSKGIYHFSKEQKDNRRKSLERLKSGKKEEVKKRAKSTHYHQTFKTEPKEAVAKKKEKKEIASQKNKPVEKPVRKGLWGKFLNWLND